MTERLRCPACGKLLVVQFASPGDRVVCPACGGSVATTQSRASLKLTTAVSQISSATTPLIGPPGTRRPAHGPRFPVAPTILAAGVAILIVGGLIVTVLYRHRLASDPPLVLEQPVSIASTGDAVLIDQVVAAKSQAEAAAYAGDLATASRKYGEVRQLVGDRTPTDPLLRRLIEQVEAGEQRVKAVADVRPATAPGSAPAPLVAVEDHSDFEPGPEVVPSPIQDRATAPVISTSATASSAGNTPATRPSTPRPAGVTDAEIGQAIRRGVDFLLKNFQDGEISPDNDFVDSQKQALDALCVYALLQASQAISDDRLNIHGKVLPELIEKLKSYDLVSDGKVTNRPITYGRSLRAAALATYARQEDMSVLKSDAAWLVQSQIGGAYSYDDLYTQLMAAGELPANTPPGQVPPANTPPAPRQRLAPRGPQSRAPLSPDGHALIVSAMVDDDGGGFGGGSPPPPIDPGPYNPPPSSPPPYTPPPAGGGGGSPPPVIPTPVPGGGGGGGGAPVPLPSSRFPRPVPDFPRPVAMFPRPVANFPRPPGTVSRAARPKGTTSVPGDLTERGPIPVPESKLPPLKITFDFPWDNSNSQYGLLGVWAGAEAGMEIPDAYWKLVEQHWLGCELRTGEWAYRKNETRGYLAMTCAGVASLLVTHDYLDGPALRGAVERPPYSKGLAAGIAWLEQGDNAVAIPNAQTHYMGYDLFGVERVGLASGYKYFGAHDWYREISKKIVPMQWPNGSWGSEDHGVDSIVDTAYTLLFLARGRHPVIMTKLKFEKSWDNRPRDVANLARWAGRELERPLNWQVVGIEHRWYDWFDSPVLYIASDAPPDLKDADYQKLKNFVDAGGLIFTHADAGSVAFNRWVPQLVQKIAPGSELKAIPDNHSIYSIQYKLGSHPILQGISNGVRLLLVHASGDVANAWQQRSSKTQRDHFQLGANIFLYASGKPDLRNRLDSPYIPAAPDAPTGRVAIARVKYDGNWDPEPAAWYRFSRYFQWETGRAAEIRPLQANELSPSVAAVASLTGIAAVQFSPGETAAMRKYVEDGGVLLIDACGGENGFTQTARDALLRGAFAGAEAVPLKPDHPLYKDLKPGLANPSPLRLRPFAIERLGQLAPEIRLLKVGKGYVVFSALDLTSGLLGTNTWGIVGYDPASTQKFVRNLVLWAQEHP